MTASPIRIGTRDSELAMWQAKNVQASLLENGHDCVIVPIKSAGDLELTTPLYEMGITGIFTKNLDIALLNNTIDIAVHSMKDVPTRLPRTLIQSAVLPRADVHDLLVMKTGFEQSGGFSDSELFVPDRSLVATGSLRRKAQWLHRYPKSEVTNLRGNVNTRLSKLEVHPWFGAIFAKAGLERLDKVPDHSLVLDWMVPAPAQGAIMIMCREQEPDILAACAQLNHADTALCVQVERDFLRVLEGGCTAPIGAIARIRKTLLSSFVDFHGVLFSVDGVDKLEVKRSVKLSTIKDFGASCAQELLDQGARDIINADAVDGEIHAIRMSMNTPDAPKQTGGDADRKIVKIESKHFDNETQKIASQAVVTDTEKSLANQETKVDEGGQALTALDVANDQPANFGNDLVADLDGPISVISTRVLTEVQKAMARGRVRVEGLDFIATKFLEIPAETVRTDSMIITSQNTVRALLASFPKLNLRFKNIYCVGTKTAQLVEERLGRVLYTAQSANGLALYLAQNMSGRSITYFCSNIRTDDIPDILAEKGIRVNEIPAYETQLTSKKIKQNYQGVMFYSPSAVQSFVQKNGTDTIAFCIGKTTAREAGVYFKEVRIAERPTIEHVLKMVNKHYA